MTPMQAIQSATSRAAELLGKRGELGVVAPGAYADLVAVAGDPLADVDVAEEPSVRDEGRRGISDPDEPSRDTADQFCGAQRGYRMCRDRRRLRAESSGDVVGAGSRSPRRNMHRRTRASSAPESAARRCAPDRTICTTLVAVGSFTDRTPVRVASGITGTDSGPIMAAGTRPRIDRLAAGIDIGRDAFRVR